MLSAKTGEAASRDLEAWANRVARRIDEAVAVTVDYDAESATYVLRLIKGARVLVFRLSADQVRTPERESECERTLQRKIKDLWHLL